MSGAKKELVNLSHPIAAEHGVDLWSVYILSEHCVFSLMDYYTLLSLPNKIYRFIFGNSTSFQTNDEKY